jgi:hypothetical protein
MFGVSFIKKLLLYLGYKKRIPKYALDYKLLEPRSPTSKIMDGDAIYI